MEEGKRQRVYVNVYKRWKERKRGSQSLRKFVVGPFAVGNEINTPSFDKKKREKSNGDKREEREKTQCFPATVSFHRCQRREYSPASQLLRYPHSSYLPSSSSNPSSPSYYTIPSTFVHPCLRLIARRPSFSHQRHSITSDLSRLQRYFHATFLLPCEFARIFPSTLFSFLPLSIPIQQFHRAELIISLNAKENPSLSV